MRDGRGDGWGMKPMDIDTERLRVRRLTEADAEDLQAVLSDPDVVAHLEAPYTPERTREFIRDCGLGNKPLVYAIEHRVAGRVIGHLIYHAFDRDDCYEIGWVLHRGYWSQGIASELTEALIARSREARLSELVIECTPEQASTKRIADKYGFEHVGVVKGLEQYRLKLKAG